jgi:hypothetical protein
MTADSRDKKQTRRTLGQTMDEFLDLSGVLFCFMTRSKGRNAGWIGGCVGCCVFVCAKLGEMHRKKLYQKRTKPKGKDCGFIKRGV